MYATLNILNQEDKNIITVEARSRPARGTTDPV